ncbi:toll-like receptor 2 isoform X2 [Palaemon carinicauda]|uniref:toll-like receptor 2 isoform X2 n=1 Tax=Palaemon carinicauda TaxID=392227 RepID=UPI0035B622D5
MCSEEPIDNSIYILRCPDVLAFDKHFIQGDNNSFEIEIESVGGVFNFPQHLGQIHLESLRISEAKLTFFNSSSETQFLKSLKKMDLSGNPDFDAQSLVNLGKLESLTYLSMRGSALKTLDKHLPYLMKNLPNLEYLNVSSTGITYLDDPDIFDSNKKLKHLDISGNDKLSVITFHADFIHQMIYLNLSNCILRRIKVEEDLLTNQHPHNQKDLGIMEVLDVSNNRLKEIPPSLLSALRNNSFSLNISGNDFGEASENCLTIHLWHFLQSLPTEVHVPGEEELRFSEDIALSKCQWNSCPPGCQCNRKKKIVDCSNIDSKLPDLLQHFPKLEQLDLSYCEIGSDDGTTIFTSNTSNTVLRSLKTLDLSGNPDFNAEDLLNLGKLECLTSLSMKGSANKTLDKHLPYLMKNLPNLEYLNVSSTGITYLDDPDIFDSNKKLKHLDISGNDKLSVITFHADFIHQIIYLNLSNCILRRIKVEEDLLTNQHPHNQKDLGIMEVLDVSNNRLKEIPPSLLSALRNNSFLLNISRNDFGEASENCLTIHLWHFLQSLPTEVHVPGEEELRFREKIALSKCQWNSCPPGCQCNSKEKIVDCSNIGLKTLPQVAPSSAETLLLQNNNLTTLEGIQSAAWCNLKILNVGYNNVSRIFYDHKIEGNCTCETKEAYSDEQAHCLPQNLEEIHLNNNTLQNFTKNDCLLLSPLHELDLSGNKMKTLASICDGPLNYLETLTVTGNTIRNISENDIYQYPKLKKLHILEGTTQSENVRLYRENLSIIVGDRKEISLDIEGSSLSTASPTGNNSSDTSPPVKEVSDELIMTAVTLLILIILVLLTCYTNYRRNSSTGIKRKFEPQKTIAKRRKYDCFVVCSSEDFTRVREMIIVPLSQRGYSIAWHENAFVPGDWIMHNVERAVQNSSRMVIFGTQNLVSSRWGLHEIRRGCHEEFVNPDFKVLALVDETLPKTLNRDLYDIICLRTHIKLTDPDYIEQICRFLPPQELPENSDLQPDNLQESLNDINELLERYEEIRRKERLTSARRLGELFHTSREQGKVSIRVDIGTAFSSHVCDNKATCPSCQKEQSALIQRFKGGPYSSSALNLSETSTRQEYTIDGESCEDITDILNEDGFIRGWKRTTC